MIVICPLSYRLVLCSTGDSSGDATILSVPAGGYMRLPLDFLVPWKLAIIQSHPSDFRVLEAFAPGKAWCYSDSIHPCGGVSRAAVGEVTSYPAKSTNS